MCGTGNVPWRTPTHERPSAPSRRRPGTRHATLPHDLARRLLGLNDDIEYRGTATLAAELAASEVTPKTFKERAVVETALQRIGADTSDPQRASLAADLLGVLRYTDPPSPDQVESAYEGDQSGRTTQQTPEQKALEQFLLGCPARPERRQRTAEPRADVAATCAAAAQERPARRRRRPRRQKGFRCAGPRARLLTLAPDVPHTRRRAARPHRRRSTGRAARRRVARAPSTRVRCTSRRRPAACTRRPRSPSRSCRPARARARAARSPLGGETARAQRRPDLLRLRHLELDAGVARVRTARRGWNERSRSRAGCGSTSPTCRRASRR